MLKKQFRLFLVTLLLLLQFVIFSGKTYAKQDNPGNGWDSGDAPGLNFDPPAFSVHPIDSPEDIPLFRAQMKKFVEDLREYIKNFVDEIRGNTP